MEGRKLLFKIAIKQNNCSDYYAKGIGFCISVAASIEKQHLVLGNIIVLARGVMGNHQSDT